MVVGGVAVIIIVGLGLWMWRMEKRIQRWMSSHPTDQYPKTPETSHILSLLLVAALIGSFIATFTSAAGINFAEATRLRVKSARFLGR